MKVKLDPGAYMPKRAHNMDAGYDLKAPRTMKEITIPPHGSAVIPTGVRMAIPEGCCGLLVSKSGLNVKSDLTSTGLIDAAYTGGITVKLYNQGDIARRICPGDKISQIVILPIIAPELEKVDMLDDTERGESGFGSTGR